jgi:hypothetical protein
MLTMQCIMFIGSKFESRLRIWFDEFNIYVKNILENEW